MPADEGLICSKTLCPETDVIARDKKTCQLILSILILNSGELGLGV